MAVKSKRSYRFAFRSAIYITLVFSIIFSLISSFFGGLNVLFLVLNTVIIFLISFFALQYRIEKFIYKRIKKIYDDVALLESTTLTSDPITTDMRTLTAEIEKFAQDKKIEIDTQQSCRPTYLYCKGFRFNHKVRSWGFKTREGRF